MDPTLEPAAARFRQFLEEQVERAARIPPHAPPPPGTAWPLIIGVWPGDGIGPVVTRETLRVLRKLLKHEIAEEEILLETIDCPAPAGRRCRGSALPREVLEQVKACNVLLKGPTVDEPGGQSIHAALRRELDLFARLRPVQVPEQGIDWVLFAENTEGTSLLADPGIRVEDVAFDVSVATRHGSERILRAAFTWARRNGIERVVGVARPDVLGTTDGLFLQAAAEVAKEFPDVEWQPHSAEDAIALLLDEARRADVRVLVSPGLHAGILGAVVSHVQGARAASGVASTGTQFGVFETTHGPALRMVGEDRAELADPTSLLRAAALMLHHAGLSRAARSLDMALDLCTLFDPQVEVTGHLDGATTRDFTNHLVNTLISPELESRWDAYSAHWSRKAARRRHLLQDRNVLGPLYT